MNDRKILTAYLCAVLLITLIHDVTFLLGGVLLLSVISGRRFFRLAKKTLLAIVVFNSVVTVSYGVLAKVQGDFSPYYLALVNLRVFLLTFSTFLLRERINLFKACEFSRSLLYLVTLSYSQILTMRRVFREFRLALTSRSPSTPSLRDRYRHSTRAGSFFISKSLKDAAGISQAMRSRGFFID